MDQEQEEVSFIYSKLTEKEQWQKTLKLPTAIKGFLKGMISQIIDVDISQENPNKVEKYVVILLEEPKSLVILKLSYSYDDDKLPALSLVKQSNKIPIDCICPCVLPTSEE